MKIVDESESMRKYLPKKKGTRNIFDYIEFLELILKDLKNAIIAKNAKLIKKWKEGR